MSFYSGLDLVANWVERVPDADTVEQFIERVGLRDPEKGYLSPELNAIFFNDENRAANPRFFTPDTISFGEGIELVWWDGAYSGSGYRLSINGNGYFFPWTMSDIHQRFLSLPKLVELRRLVQEAFGGGFRFPDDAPQGLKEHLIGEAGGWVWFGWESG